jgi:hypothetical protein
VNPIAQNLKIKPFDLKMMKSPGLKANYGSLPQITGVQDKVTKGSN